jgi:hypothetical protein
MHPCDKGERLATLETILESVSETLVEQKALGVRTYDVLASISGQSEQIASLVTRTDKTERDIQGLFGRVRDVELIQADHTAVISVNRAAIIRTDQIKSPLIAGLILAMVIAIFTFGFSMYARHATPIAQGTSK